jgi:hypothetical protein
LGRWAPDCADRGMKTFLSSALVLLLTSLAGAQDYQITGPELTGRAHVEKGKAHIRVALGKDMTKFKVKAVNAAFKADGSLELSWDVVVKPGVRKGLATWIKSPGWSLDAWNAQTVTKRTTLRPRGGSLVGDVAGYQQTWTRTPASAKNWTVLVIPGLSTNNWNKVGIPYLDENIRTLKARGLRARRVKIKTEDGVAKNAAFIAEQVRVEARAGRRCVIMAHSKGATDTTAAIALHPEIIPHVVGVIAIQPVYGGSYVADLVGSSRALTASMALVFEKVFKGQRSAVLDLTHSARSAFVAKHPYPATRVPTVVIRSTFDRKMSLSVLYAPQKYTKWRHKKASDGMVALADQSIPGAAKTVTLKDLDHFEPGVRLESDHKPNGLTNRAMDALLRVLGTRQAR